MPIKNAAKKRVRADVKRRERNIKATSELKTLSKNAHSSIAAKDLAKAKPAVAEYVRRLDMAAGKKIIARRRLTSWRTRIKDCSRAVKTA